MKLLTLLTKQPSKGPAAIPAPSPARQAAQDWLPLLDLHDGLLFRPDGAVVGGIGIAPFSLALKSRSETKAIIGAVHQALNAIDRPWEILSVFRPVDLDAYLVGLDALLRTVDAQRKTVLRDYLSWVHDLVRSGDAVERRYYFLVTRTGADAPAEHRVHLPALAQDLQRARGFRARVMDDAAWRELLFLFFHGAQAAVEAVPDGLGRVPPIYVPDKEDVA